MTDQIAQNAYKSNPALKPFEVLIGQWNSTGKHPFFPDAALTGRAVFEWYADGAFLVFRSEIDHPKFPHGIQIFGSDDAAGMFFMLHFDERGTSRKYDVELESDGFTWYRNDPEFSQRFTLSIKEGGQRLESTGKMSRKGGEWEDDLSLVLTRA